MYQQSSKTIALEDDWGITGLGKEHNAVRGRLASRQFILPVPVRQQRVPVLKAMTIPLKLSGLKFGKV
jgi:hypothetical protein